MSNPNSHREAKRLAKSIKRRRLFAEQLRIEAQATRAAGHLADIEQGRLEAAFADRLDAIASREFDLANEEERQHLAVAVRHEEKSRFDYTPSAETLSRQTRALAVLDERGSAARVRHMANTFGIAKADSAAASTLLKQLEDALDNEKMDTPANRDGMTFGRRISNAEKLLFGAVRF